MKSVLLAATLALVLSGNAGAKTYEEMFGAKPAVDETYTKVLNAIDYRQGTVDLPTAKAKIMVPEGFYFLGPADTERVLVELWGNPAGAADGSLGMLFPLNYAPDTENSWGSIIHYIDDGYVSDIDAMATDYDALLAELKQSAIDGNVEREKLGYEPIELVGWASPPFYDQKAHALHWGRDLLFGKDSNATHTLNYSVRILGREGVLQMNFVAGLGQLEEIKASIPIVTDMIKFDTGSRYTDFAEGDKVAAYGVAGLIAAGAGAKIAAKVGFLAAALLFLKKGGLLILLAAGGLLSKLKGLFGAKTPPAT